MHKNNAWSRFFCRIAERSIYIQQLHMILLVFFQNGCRVDMIFLSLRYHLCSIVMQLVGIVFNNFVCMFLSICKNQNFLKPKSSFNCLKNCQVQQNETCLNGKCSEKTTLDKKLPNFSCRSVKKIFRYKKYSTKEIYSPENSF